MLINFGYCRNIRYSFQLNFDILGIFCCILSIFLDFSSNMRFYISLLNRDLMCCKCCSLRCRVGCIGCFIVYRLHIECCRICHIRLLFLVVGSNRVYSCSCLIELCCLGLNKMYRFLILRSSFCI